MARTAALVVLSAATGVFVAIAEGRKLGSLWGNNREPQKSGFWSGGASEKIEQFNDERKL